MKFTTALCCIILVCSCKKDKVPTEELSGYVIHQISRQPVANQEVILDLIEVDPSKKDPEYPNGKPYLRKLKTLTNEEGKYSFLVNGYSSLPKPYLGKGGMIGSAIGFVWNTTFFSRRQLDTIFAEKAGYIKYTVENTGSTFPDDTLSVKKSYSAAGAGIIPVTGGDFIADGRSWISYNMIFVGTQVNKVIIDTVAAETVSKYYVEWTYKRATIVTQVKDSIAVSPGLVSERLISY